MKIVWIALIVLIGNSTFASQLKASCYVEFDTNATYFRQRTTHTAICRHLCQQCLMGLNTLISLIPDDVFRSEHFGAIFIGDTFRDTTVDGYITIDFSASAADIRAHLANQSDDYGTIQELSDQFLRTTSHSAICAVRSKSQCIEGLRKLVAISTHARLFTNANFQTIIVADLFMDESDGYVRIDYAATSGAIEAHLQRQ